MPETTHQIGEAAARTGLSLRTVRYYDSVGLVTPSARTEGGFRLYTEADLQRLLLIRALKPADFSLDQLHEVMTLRDRLMGAGGKRSATDESRYRALVDVAAERVRTQRERLVAAELAVLLLRHGLDDRVGPTPEPSREAVEA